MDFFKDQFPWDHFVNFVYSYDEVEIRKNLSEFQLRLKFCNLWPKLGLDWATSKLSLSYSTNWAGPFPVTCEWTLATVASLQVRSSQKVCYSVASDCFRIDLNLALDRRWNALHIRTHRPTSNKCSNSGQALSLEQVANRQFQLIVGLTPDFRFLAWPPDSNAGAWESCRCNSIADTFNIELNQQCPHCTWTTVQDNPTLFHF